MVSGNFWEIYIKNAPWYINTQKVYVINSGQSPMDHRFKMLALDCGLLEGNENLVSPDQRNECINEQQKKCVNCSKVGILESLLFSSTSSSLV